MVTWGVKNVRVPQITSPCSLAGTAVTCSVPAVATRGSQCQASSCLSPVASVRPATAISSMAQLPWSWRSPLQPAPTEVQRTRTDGSRAELQVADAEALLKSTGAKECPTNFVSAAALWSVSVCVKEKLSGMLVRWDCAQRNETGHPGALDQAGRGGCLTVFAEVSWRTLVCEGFSWRSWKNHKGFSSPSLEHGLITAGCSDILAITRLSLSIGNIHIASQCLSERLKEQFIQITRGDGSHIPSLPMVPTFQEN